MPDQGSPRYLFGFGVRQLAAALSRPAGRACWAVHRRVRAWEYRLSELCYKVPAIHKEIG